jgi:hypothetical protein
VTRGIVLQNQAMMSYITTGPLESQGVDRTTNRHFWAFDSQVFSQDAAILAGHFDITLNSLN